MEKLKQIAYTHQNKFEYLLYAGVGLAVFNTLARADYNFITYLYMLYVWKFLENTREVQTNEKINMFFMLAFSLLIDFIWVIYWGSKWSALKNDYEETLHTLVLISSWLAIVLKILIIGFIGIIEWGSIKSSLPAKLREKLNAASNYQSQRDDSAVV